VVILMPLGLRTWLRLKNTALDAELARGAAIAAAMTPKQLDACLGRALARGPQSPAPFKLTYQPAPEGCYIWPCAAEPNPYG
jgi:hypothetical protein